jgi:hypothetical protein
MEKIIREVRYLKLYSLVLTCMLLFFVLMSFRRDSGKPKFQEIDVERINVVEKDGTLKLVISNSERQHPGMSEGKEMTKRERPAGMIFFNGDGDECGGLVYEANKKEAGMVYSVDQYRNDQIMQLQYSQNNTGTDKLRSYGLKLWDRPDDFTLARVNKIVDSLEALKDKAAFDQEIDRLSKAGKFGAERLFVGKNKLGEVGLFIRDEKGTVRIKIYVDKEGKAYLQSLDERGQEQHK